MTGRLTTEEVARRLGVKPATVYAYVSRGRLTSERGADGSTFDPVEVEALAGQARRAPAPLSRPMQFVTGLTLIDDGRPWYRGLDATALAGSRRFEEVGEWLLTGSWSPSPSPWTSAAPVAPVLAALGPGASPVDRFKVAVAAAATSDPLRHDLSPSSVAAVGRELVAMLASDLGAPKRAGIAATVAGGLIGGRVPPGAVAAIDAAMVLLADHELAASTLAARTAAAFGADPYGVVGAGMAAASGSLHAAASTDAHALLLDASARGGAAAVGELLRRGQRIPGCGMPLYPDGDPRAVRLFELLAAVRVDEARRRVVDDVRAAVGRPGIPPPNIDMALAALMFLIGAPVGSGEAVFVLARVVGWVAHAIEQYAAGEGGARGTFRVRATYVGPRPSPGA